MKLIKLILCMAIVTLALVPYTIGLTAGAIFHFAGFLYNAMKVGFGEAVDDCTRLTDWVLDDESRIWNVSVEVSGE